MGTLTLIHLFLLIFFLSLSHFFFDLFPLSIPGFPLDKAVAYSKLRNPFLINDLAMQYYIQDRYSFLLIGGMVGPEIISVYRALSGRSKVKQTCLIFVSCPLEFSTLISTSSSANEIPSLFPWSPLPTSPS